MKTKYLIAFLCCLPLAWSCSHKDIDLFETDDAGVRFQFIGTYTWGSTLEYYADSTSRSFAKTPGEVTFLDLEVPLQTMGKQRNYPRPVKVVLDPERTTGIEGVHYQLKLDTVNVPAHSSTGKVIIRFLRSPDLQENTYTVALKLEENEHFKCYFPEYKNNNSPTVAGDMISGVKFVASINEVYSKPRYWRYYGDEFFGEWTAKKYGIVNMVCGLSEEDWQLAGTSGAKIKLGRFDYFTRAVRKHLQQMADEGSPETEKDGSYMQLGPDYQVDYSAYNK